MTSTNFASAGVGMPASGLASRRGGQNIKPLSFDAMKASDNKDNGAPTPRTSRSHLLAGLRTAPKTAVASTFASSQTSGMAQPQQQYARNVSGGYTAAQDAYNPPKTALPRFNQQQQAYSNGMNTGLQFTPDQVLAPPEIQIDDHSAEQLDPNTYAQLLTTNMYLAHQQQQLQQQLRDIQMAAQQFSQLNMGGRQQQMYAQQQGGLQNMSPMSAQPKIYTYVDPATGQQTYVLDQSGGAQYSPYVDQTQVQIAQQYAVLQQQQQQQQQMQMQMQANSGTPRVQVSPPPENVSTPFRSNSPPKRYESPSEVTPLPPPSANAFRRGHKKASSLANANGLSVNVQDAQKGPKTAAFPLSPLTGGYGPGQARAGEHPVRQPRGPPSFDELAAKPTAKHEGSKNFAARTRRSAVHNLVRAGKERRKGTGSSTGSMSPVSESAEESETPITDNDSESGRSGPGSLSGDMECSLPSSRTSTSGSWGAIGSERPSSRQQARDGEMDGSFASVFKHGPQSATKLAQSPDGQRKTPRLILTKNTPAVAA